MKEESLWIGEQIDIILKKKKINTCLDIGSSTLVFRTKIQPHIEQNIFKKLSKSRVKVVHMDQKKSPGVDLVLDINNLETINNKYDLIILANVLEHVINPSIVLEKVNKIISPRGLLIITVPHKYVYHPDPIDTFFRPNISEMRFLLKDYEVINSQIISGSPSNNKFHLICGSIKNIFRDSKYNLFLKNLFYVFDSKVLCCIVRKK